MNKIYLMSLLIFTMFIMTSCAKEITNVIVTPSETELFFSYEHDEQTISIVSDGDWYCDYDADWLTVRQRRDAIRVIVDENNTDSTRTCNIRFIINENVCNEIVVTQAGKKIIIDTIKYSVCSAGDTLYFPVYGYISDTINWCTSITENDNLMIVIDRNYNMIERSGVITVKSGERWTFILINQFGCQWYESFEMVNVVSGSFYMGAQSANPEDVNYDAYAYEIESPVHFVSVDGFFICKYEVTQAQWFAAMGSNPSTHIGDNLPVENVTWEQVQEFISLLNSYSGLNYRLPTESEWEFAAKGGIYSEGTLYSGSSILGACGWYYSNSESSTHAVGSKAPNELGIYDMSGNVREWCSDWLDYYSSNNENNPVGPSSGYLKVNRGGGWSSLSDNCRCTYRHSNYPDESSYDLGFRLALSY